MVGEANEVPFPFDTLPSLPDTTEFWPTAITSGLIRPSDVLPIDEKSALINSLVKAPTVMTCSESPGGVIFFQLPLPEFPALHTTTIPLSAAKEAEWDIKEACPSKSRYR